MESTGLPKPEMTTGPVAANKKARTGEADAGQICKQNYRYSLELLGTGAE